MNPLTYNVELDSRLTDFDPNTKNTKNSEKGGTSFGPNINNTSIKRMFFGLHATNIFFS